VREDRGRLEGKKEEGPEVRGRKSEIGNWRAEDDRAESRN